MGDAVRARPVSVRVGLKPSSRSSTNNHGHVVRCTNRNPAGQDEALHLELQPARGFRLSASGAATSCYCANTLSRSMERNTSSVQTFPQDLLEACVWYDWPGNVRQL